MDFKHFLVVEMQNNRCEYEYIHDGKGGISTAFHINKKAEIKINIPRSLGAIDVYLDIFGENATNKLCEIKAEWCSIDREFDSYIFEINTKELGTGLYFLRPRLSVFAGKLYGHKWAGSIYFDSYSDTYNMMQMTICDYT